jgi:hypothetical protein
VFLYRSVANLATDLYKSTVVCLFLVICAWVRGWYNTIMVEIISYKMCAVKVRNAKLRNTLIGYYNMKYFGAIYSKFKNQNGGQSKSMYEK